MRKPKDYIISNKLSKYHPQLYVQCDGIPRWIVIHATGRVYPTPRQARTLAKRLMAMADWMEDQK